MLARAAGFISYAAFAFSTIAGLALSSRFIGKKGNRALTIVHEAAAIAGVLVLLLHIVAILNDGFFEFTIRSIVLPGASPYEPFWVGVGVIATYAAIIVTLSFYVRRRIGPKLWRKIHYSTLGIFVAMTLHGLMTGTDSGNPLALALYASATVTTLALTVDRVFEGFAEAKRKTEREALREAKKAEIAKKKAAGSAPTTAPSEA